MLEYEYLQVNASVWHNYHICNLATTRHTTATGCGKRGMEQSPLSSGLLKVAAHSMMHFETLPSVR